MTNADLDDTGYAEIQHRFERGDYHDPVEFKAVKNWLRTQDKEREHLAACERASISSALEATRAAQRANLVAFLALVVSAISAREEVAAIVRVMLNAFTP